VRLPGYVQPGTERTLAMENVARLRGFPRALVAEGLESKLNSKRCRGRAEYTGSLPCTSGAALQCSAVQRARNREWCYRVDELSQRL
jgi:hypothetical protein